MIDETYDSAGGKLRYRSPAINVIPINVRDMLCSSGNAPMGEGDYGDGGFHQS